MKSIKVKDQKIMSLAKTAADAQTAMHYWTGIYVSNRNVLFKEIRKQFPKLENEAFVYNPRTSTIEPNYVEDEQKEAS